MQFMTYQIKRIRLLIELNAISPTSNPGVLLTQAAQATHDYLDEKHR
jgi:hypothetical protein